ncbi:MAG: hypothetical protein Q8K98_14425 [Bacteroidota bacterium]|nr:hypothetical protein [Bacteroidota bacterium]
MKNFICMKYLCVSIYILILFLIFPSNIFTQDIDDCGTEKSLRDFLVLGKTSGRPTLSGTVQYIFTANFKIHYTLSGQDATTLAWAESTAVYAEYCWRICDSLGWINPPPDYGEGGDNRYDIYIRHTSIDGYWGAAK